ncbi:exo-alpha-sialidase [Myxococcota bacterium]|nr:exo-alpha-sialidase [Myxococcota bacterium]
MSDRLWVGTRKGLFRLDRISGNWKITATKFLGVSVPMVLADPRDGAVYAALGHGHFGAKLHRSDDGGETFVEIGVPTYPPKPEGLDDRDGNGQPLAWTLTGIWALEAGHASEPGALWCGTIPGGLFRSDDRGATWSLVRSLWDDPRRNRWFGGGADLPGIHSVCVDPRDPKRVFVGVSCGGVWLTEDGGATWDVRADGMRAEFMPPDRQGDPLIQDPHRVVACAASPDHLWAQHHNGVFKTTDAGRSWTELKVPPSSFGFAAAVHPKDPNVAWFVPGVKDEVRIPVDGKLVVARTRDGGRTFDVLTRGLPQEHAYDLVLRHALDIDRSGDRLAFGSTTGSLWLTEDGGDAWTHLSAHLPPIYVTHFDHTPR